MRLTGCEVEGAKMMLGLSAAAGGSAPIASGPNVMKSKAGKDRMAQALSARGTPGKTISGGTGRAAARSIPHDRY